MDVCNVWIKSETWMDSKRGINETLVNHFLWTTIEATDSGIRAFLAGFIQSSFE